MRDFNSITKGLRKTIGKLRKLSASNDAKIEEKRNAIDSHRVQIAAHQAGIRAHQTESDRALVTADKIGDLIGE